MFSRCWTVIALLLFTTDQKKIPKKEFEEVEILDIVGQYLHLWKRLIFEILPKNSCVFFSVWKVVSSHWKNTLSFCFRIKINHNRLSTIFFKIYTFVILCWHHQQIELILLNELNCSKRRSLLSFFPLDHVLNSSIWWKIIRIFDDILSRRDEITWTIVWDHNQNSFHFYCGRTFLKTI